MVYVDCVESPLVQCNWMAVDGHVMKIPSTDLVKNLSAIVLTEMCLSALGRV